MQINGLYDRNNGALNFGHTFRVKIGIVNPDGTGYKFVNPASDKKLYQQLNSKVVGWLNEDYITRVRNVVNTPRKKVQKIQTNSDKWFKNLLSRSLTNLDSDYKDFSLVRSVYRRGRYGYIATGVDVPIIDNILGAKEIGIAKKEALITTGITHNPYINEIVRQFRRNCEHYVQDPINILRNKNGHELMLELNFTPAKTKNGKNSYNLVNYQFKEIKKTLKMLPDIHNLMHNKVNIFEYIKQTIEHNIKSTKTTSKIPNYDSKELMRSHAFDNLQRTKTRRPRKIVDDPRQLTIKFDDF